MTLIALMEQLQKQYTKEEEDDDCDDGDYYDKDEDEDEEEEEEEEDEEWTWSGRRATQVARRYTCLTASVGSCRPDSPLARYDCTFLPR